MTYYLVDVFGNTRYSGNKVAVFFDLISRKLPLSVKICTPEKEIEFAGHLTLGTACYSVIKKLSSR